jgi:hypothetical protein
MTSQKPTNPQQKSTPQPKRPAPPRNKPSSCDNDDTPTDKYTSCLIEWLGVNPDCQGMWDDKLKMLAHHEGTMGNAAVPIIQQAVHKDPKYLIESQQQIIAAMYAMRETMV